ncbi:hypothetical protein LRE75_33120 [Streptomyces sp. 372A]
MYEKPDLDTPLAALRTDITAWQASRERHLSEERKGKGVAFDVQLLEGRDDIAEKIVEAFSKIDTEMSKRRVIDNATPTAWSTERLTDAKLAAAKADCPELSLFNDVTLRLAADAIGIRMVRDMARQAVRNAPAVLDSRTK